MAAMLQLSHIHMNVETLRVAAMHATFSLPMLQLSHIHMNVETLNDMDYDTFDYVMLQLSHIHMNVETSLENGSQYRNVLNASIEPHSYECGNRLGALNG